MTVPQVAPAALAMRLPDTEPGAPDANACNAASSMLSRVACPRRLERRPLGTGTTASLTRAMLRDY
ncbi:hypothetical protein GCM10010409_27730 [Mycolicibacterium diernhoferi]